jgi:hypothetical protein
MVKPQLITLYVQHFSPLKHTLREIERGGVRGREEERKGGREKERKRGREEGRKRGILEELDGDLHLHLGPKRTPTSDHPTEGCT